MQYRALGKTGLTLSEIGFGGWAIGGSISDSTSLAALNRAYELGCTVFETADVFGAGRSETLIGQALKGWERERVIICTQGGQDFTPAVLEKTGAPKPNFSATYLRQALEASLKRLDVEVIDLYLLQTPPLELVQHGKIFDLLEVFKQEGKVRFTGIAIHDPQEGIQAIQKGKVDVVQAIYNLFDTRAAKLLMQTCAETQTGLLIREPLARGFLSGRFTPDMTFEPGDVRAIWPKPLIQKRIEAANRFKPLLPEGYQNLSELALAYPLARPEVACVVVGCKTPEQVTENMAVSDRSRLSTETVDAIARIQENL